MIPGKPGSPWRRDLDRPCPQALATPLPLRLSPLRQGGAGRPYAVTQRGWSQKGPPLSLRCSTLFSSLGAGLPPATAAALDSATRRAHPGRTASRRAQPLRPAFRRHAAALQPRAAPQRAAKQGRKFRLASHSVLFILCLHHIYMLCVLTCLKYISGTGDMILFGIGACNPRSPRKEPTPQSCPWPPHVCHGTHGNKNKYFRYNSAVCEVAQWVTASASNPENLSSIRDPHHAKREQTPPPKLSFDLWGYCETVFRIPFQK